MTGMDIHKDLVNLGKEMTDGELETFDVFNSRVGALKRAGFEK